MAQPQRNIQIAAPGFAGLNTQDSPVGMDLSFAAKADNCVIDRLGRISSRKGFQAFTDDPEGVNQIGVATADTAYEFLTEAGVSHALFSGGGSMWSQDSAGIATEVSGLSATNNNWDYAALSDQCFIAQEGETVQYTDDGTSFQAMTQQPQEVPNPNIITAGLGHLFVASSALKKSTVEWSVVSPQGGLGTVATAWTGGGSGSINVEEYWPHGSDNITALAIFGGSLVIFGRRSIRIYTIPKGLGVTNAGPEYMVLDDTLDNVGCIARDSVVSTGTDLLFLDSTGVRSLNRTVEFKSLPLGDMSINVRDQLIRDLGDICCPIRATYSQEESMYILIIPKTLGSDDVTVTYVFDTRQPLENGSLRATQWLGRSLRCALRTFDGKLYIGRPGGLYEYTGGNDTSLLSGEDTTRGVTFNYVTHPQDFDSPSNFKFPKQVDIIAIGASTFLLEVSWYFDFSTNENSKTISNTSTSGAQWGIGIWGVGGWGDSGGSIVTDYVNMWGQGKNITLALSGNISEEPLSIQELNLQALLGRIK